MKPPAPLPPDKQKDVTTEDTENTENKILSTHNAIVYQIDGNKQWFPLSPDYLSITCVDCSLLKKDFTHQIIVKEKKQILLECPLVPSTRLKIKDTFVRWQNENATYGARFTNEEVALKFYHQLNEVLSDISVYAKVVKPKLNSGISTASLDLDNLPITPTPNKVLVFDIEVKQSEIAQFQSSEDSIVKDFLLTVCTTAGVNPTNYTLVYMDSIDILDVQAKVKTLKSQKLKLIKIKDLKKHSAAAAKQAKPKKRSNAGIGSLFSRSKSTPNASSTPDLSEFKLNYSDPIWKTFLDLANIQEAEVHNARISTTIEQFVEIRGGYSYLQQVNDVKISPQIADDLNNLAGQVHAMMSPEPAVVNSTMKPSPSTEKLTTTLERKKRKAPPPPVKIDRQDKGNPLVNNIRKNSPVGTPSGKRRAPSIPKTVPKSPSLSSSSSHSRVSSNVGSISSGDMSIPTSPLPPDVFEETKKLPPVKEVPTLTHNNDNKTPAPPTEAEKEKKSDCNFTLNWIESSSQHEGLNRKTSVEKPPPMFIAPPPPSEPPPDEISSPVGPLSPNPEEDPCSNETSVTSKEKTMSSDVTDSVTKPSSEIKLKTATDSSNDSHKQLEDMVETNVQLEVIGETNVDYHPIIDTPSKRTESTIKIEEVQVTTTDKSENIGNNQEMKTSSDHPNVVNIKNKQQIESSKETFERNNYTSKHEDSSAGTVLIKSKEINKIQKKTETNKAANEEEVRNIECPKSNTIENVHLSTQDEPVSITEINTTPSVRTSVERNAITRTETNTVVNTEISTIERLINEIQQMKNLDPQQQKFFQSQLQLLQQQLMHATGKQSLDENPGNDVVDSKTPSRNSSLPTPTTRSDIIHVETKQASQERNSEDQVNVKRHSNSNKHDVYNNYDKPVSEKSYSNELVVVNNSSNKKIDSDNATFHDELTETRSHKDETSESEIVSSVKNIPHPHPSSPNFHNNSDISSTYLAEKSKVESIEVNEQVKDSQASVLHGSDAAIPKVTSEQTIKSVKPSNIAKDMPSDVVGETQSCGVDKIVDNQDQVGVRKSSVSSKRPPSGLYAKLKAKTAAATKTSLARKSSLDGEQPGFKSVTSSFPHNSLESSVANKTLDKKSKTETIPVSNDVIIKAKDNDVMQNINSDSSNVENPYFIKQSSPSVNLETSNIKNNSTNNSPSKIIESHKEQTLPVSDERKQESSIKKENIIETQKQQFQTQVETKADSEVLRKTSYDANRVVVFPDESRKEKGKSDQEVFQNYKDILASARKKSGSRSSSFVFHRELSNAQPERSNAPYHSRNDNAPSAVESTKANNHSTGASSSSNANRFPIDNTLSTPSDSGVRISAVSPRELLIRNIAEHGIPSDNSSVKVTSNINVETNRHDDIQSIMTNDVKNHNERKNNSKTKPVGSVKKEFLFSVPAEPVNQKETFIEKKPPLVRPKPQHQMSLNETGIINGSENGFANGNSEHAYTRSFSTSHVKKQPPKVLKKPVVTRRSMDTTFLEENNVKPSQLLRASQTLPRPSHKPQNTFTKDIDFRATTPHP